MPHGVELPTTYTELQAVKDRIQILIPNEEYLVLDNDNLIAIATGEDAGRIEMNGETLNPMYEDAEHETIWGFFECGNAEQPVITEEVKEPTYVDFIYSNFNIIDKTLDEVKEILDNQTLEPLTYLLLDNKDVISYNLKGKSLSTLFGATKYSVRKQLKTNHTMVLAITTSGNDPAYEISEPRNTYGFDYMITTPEGSQTNIYLETNQNRFDSKKRYVARNYIIFFEIPKFTTGEITPNDTWLLYEGTHDIGLKAKLTNSMTGIEFYKKGSDFPLKTTQVEIEGVKTNVYNYTNDENFIGDNLISNDYVQFDIGANYSTNYKYVTLADDIVGIYNNIRLKTNTDYNIQFKTVVTNNNSKLYNETDGFVDKLNNKDYTSNNISNMRFYDHAFEGFDPNTDFELFLLDS